MHFIGDAKTAGCAHLFVDVLQIIVRINNHAAHALDRFGDERRDASRSAEIDQVLHIGRVLVARFGIVAAPQTAIGIGRHGVMNPEAVRDVELPGPMRGQAHGQRTAAVIAVAQRDHVVIAGVGPRHEQGEIVRFRTGINEITYFEIVRHFRRQLARVFGNIGMQINRSRMLQSFVLLPRNIDNVGMTMTDAHRHDAAERVEITPAALVPDILHFSLHQHERLFVVEKNSRIQELLTQTQDFIGGRPVVFLQLVIKGRKLGSFHIVMLSEVEASLFISELRPRKVR